MKNLFIVCVAFTLCVIVDYAEAATLTVTARQRYPWNGLVDIDCTVQGLDTTPISFTAKDGLGQKLSIETLTLNGNVFTNGVSMVSDGSYRFVWNATADLGEGYKAKNISITVKNVVLRYLIIDLSEGKDATSYPTFYLEDVPSGGWTEEYKTTKLVMRRIQAGSFTMGSPSNESGRTDSETQHRVTLTKDFYIGIFEVTQKQYQLVTGENPSDAYLYTMNNRPVESISWNTITASDGFIARLRNRTGFSMSLPTEAQWEYACRAGTTTAYNSGKAMSESNMAEVGRFSDNSNDGKGSSYGQYHTVVGSYEPNGWGLYDMHGNVWEWCSDWYASLGTGSVTNPTGGSSGTYRVVRGGGWTALAKECRSAMRYMEYPSEGDTDRGFRILCTPK